MQLSVSSIEDKKIKLEADKLIKDLESKIASLSDKDLIASLTVWENSFKAHLPAKLLSLFLKIRRKNSFDHSNYY